MKKKINRLLLKPPKCDIETWKVHFLTIAYVFSLNSMVWWIHWMASLSVYEVLWYKIDSWAFRKWIYTFFLKKTIKVLRNFLHLSCWCGCYGWHHNTHPCLMLKLSFSITAKRWNSDSHTHTFISITRERTSQNCCVFRKK